MYLEDRTIRLQLWDTAGQEYCSFGCIMGVGDSVVLSPAIFGILV